jgi:preprotein translocase subunit YajC
MEVAIIYFVVLVAAFYLLIVRPQRRRNQAHRAFFEALSIGDEVITNGGIFGTVRGLDDDTVDLEVAPGVVLHVARAAVAQPVPPESPPGTEPGAPPALGDGDER